MPVPFPARHGPASGASSAVLPPRSGVAFFPGLRAHAEHHGKQRPRRAGGFVRPLFLEEPFASRGGLFSSAMSLSRSRRAGGIPLLRGHAFPAAFKAPCLRGGRDLRREDRRARGGRRGAACPAVAFPSSLWRGPAREGKRRPGRSFPGMGKLRLFHTVVDGRDVFSRCGRFLPYAEKKRLRAAKDGMPRVMPRAGDCKGSRRRRCGHE